MGEGMDLVTSSTLMFRERHKVSVKCSLVLKSSQRDSLFADREEINVTQTNEDGLL